ncbi:HIT family protein [Paenibacillus agri]|uniref:HIT domain-containing protein n=1 Tax=Paenibacillus agri TaxID=2744309 RepID=A0A850ECQ1_9BACL|nr:HIT domain-containing protein [Paenibacillus agri]NUU58985.1 HIT domain-containing protein [Paenibacillus agri]
MNQDFYCNEVLNERTPVSTVFETESVLAFHHTRPFYEHHIVVIPKSHISSLISDEAGNTEQLLLEILRVIKKVAAIMVDETGASKIITNLGEYQDTKHLHWHVVSGERIR